MSSKSNDNGRAYEFAYAIVLEREIVKFRTIHVVKDNNYTVAENAWGTIGGWKQKIFLESALAGVVAIFDLEPRILEPTEDILTLKIQPDSAGEAGDVRDIVLTRDDIEWEIGLSVKNNHFAVKHSRLSNNIDFGDKWFGVKCSADYWAEIKPIFDRLTVEKQNKKNWDELSDKFDGVYIPLLNAFMSEIRRINKIEPRTPTKMVEYLLGNFDFYKLISLETKMVTIIETYNLRGTLNKETVETKPRFTIPLSQLPSRIVCMDYKPGSSTTVELYLDGGWSFSFRIHNASSKVEPSLKFDIQILGMPITVLTLHSKWLKDC